MESLDFILVVVPLTIIVATLSVLVYYYAHKEEFNKRKTAKMIQEFLQTRVEQQAVIRRELGKMDEMYKTGNISKSTHQRLQNIIEMTQEKQRFETLFMLSDKKTKPKKELQQITVEKILAQEQEEMKAQQQADKANIEQEPPAEKPKRIRKKKVPIDETKETLSEEQVVDKASVETAPIVEAPKRVRKRKMKNEQEVSQEQEVPKTKQEVSETNVEQAPSVEKPKRSRKKVKNEQDVSQKQQEFETKQEIDVANIEKTPTVEKPKRIRKRKVKTDEKTETQLGLIAGEIAPEISDNSEKTISKKQIT